MRALVGVRPSSGCATKLSCSEQLGCGRAHPFRPTTSWSARALECFHCFACLCLLLCVAQLLLVSLCDTLALQVQHGTVALDTSQVFVIALQTIVPGNLQQQSILVEQKSLASSKRLVRIGQTCPAVLLLPLQEHCDCRCHRCVAGARQHTCASRSFITH